MPNQLSDRDSYLRVWLPPHTIANLTEQKIVISTLLRTGMLSGSAEARLQEAHRILAAVEQAHNEALTAASDEEESCFACHGTGKFEPCADEPASTPTLTCAECDGTGKEKP